MGDKKEPSRRSNQGKLVLAAVFRLWRDIGQEMRPRYLYVMKGWFKLSSDL
jgi:hypothetical protein